jgi:YD repeat-containing protein
LQDADTYYPSPAPTYHGTGSSGSEKVNVSNWDDQSRLHDYFTIAEPMWPQGRLYNDVEGDEFSFNFGSYSGKFYYSGPTSQWQVVSSENIKIEVNDFLTSSEVFSQLDDYMQFTPSFYLTDQGYQSRMFKGFTLTVADGTKYIFGGADAVEYVCTYGTTLRNFTATNWLLKKIIDVNGNEVNFEYRRSYPTVNLFFGHTDFSYNASPTSGICGQSDGTYTGQVDTRKHSGLLQWPMYLNKITCAGESVEFTGVAADCLRYSNVQLSQILEGTSNTSPNLFDLSFLGIQQYDLNNLNNLQWEKLTWIIIKNSKQDILKKYNFYYDPVNTVRLTLKQLTELNPAEIKSAQYSFFYNAVSDLPSNYFGDMVDHWGFYNNRSVYNMDLAQVIANGTKETDINYVTKGLLTEIKYPTGGSTKFDWEAHDYSSVVSLARNSLMAASGYAGGSRIWRIQNYSPEGTLLSEKKYYYKKNYTAGADPLLLPSSGVLNGKPQYYFPISNRTNYGNTGTFNITLGSINSLSTYSYNAQGSHIGYDEVVEINSDGSYTKNYFTNYGTDLNGNSHYDQQPAIIGWVSGDDTYMPMNSLELERGNPIAVYKYSAQNTLVQKKIITYRTDAARFNSFVKRIDFNASYYCRADVVLLIAAARKEFNYVYYPVKTEIIDYDEQGGNPVSVSQTLTYNSYNLLSQTEETDSKGIKQTSFYKYPFDFGSDPTFTAMVNAHILSPVVETSKSSSMGNLVTPLNLTRTNYYSPFTGIMVPSNIQQQKGANPIETVQLFNQYDTKGNLLETQKANDIKEVYLWGYSGQYPVAKVIGSDYNTVQSFISQAKLDNAGLIYTDADIRLELKKIRDGLAATKALVTTYTYAPLIGLTSETDPNGRTLYYEYDSWGRLQIIKDQNGNVIKTFDYQYKQ